MSDNTLSVDKSKTTGRTAADDVHDKKAADKAVEKGKGTVEEIAKTAAESVLPPGVRIPRTKR